MLSSIGTRDEFWNFEALAAREEEQKQKRVEKHSTLRQESADEIDFSLFASLCGDGHIGTFPLNVTQIQIFKYLLNFLQSEKVQKLDFSKTIKRRLAQFCQEIQECADIYQDIQSAHADTLESCAQKLAALFQKKDVLWFPLFYQSIGNQHASLLCRLDKKKGVSFIDSEGGDNPILREAKNDPISGALFHEFKRQLHIDIQGVDKKRLGDAAFFQTLIEYARKGEWEGNYYPRKGDIIASLAGYLKGKVSPGKGGYKKPRKSPQVERVKGVTTALAYVLSGAFENRSDPEGIRAFKTLKFFWQWQALTDALSLKCDVLPTDTVRFIKDIASNLARSAEKRALPDAMQERLYTTLLDVEKRIHQSHEESRQSATLPKLQNGVKQSLAMIPAADAIGERYIQIDGFQQHAVAEMARRWTEELAKNPLLPLHKVVDPVAELERYVRVFEAGNPSFYTFKRFCEVVGQLPVAKKGDACFWNGGVFEGREVEALSALNQLMKRLTLLQMERFQNQGPDATTLTLYYTLFSAIDALARRCSEAKLTGFHGDLDHQLKKLISSPSFVLPDPEMQAQLIDVLDYFCPSWTLKDFSLVSSPEKVQTEGKSSAFLFGSLQDSILTVSEKDLKKDATLRYYQQFLNEPTEEVDTRLNEAEVGHGCVIDQIAALIADEKVVEKGRGDCRKVIFEPWLPQSASLFREALLRVKYHCYYRKECTYYFHAGIQSIKFLPPRIIKEENPRTLSLRLQGEFSSGQYYPLSLQHPSTSSFLRHEGVSQNKHMADRLKTDGLGFEESQLFSMLGCDLTGESYHTLFHFCRRHFMTLKDKKIQEMVRIHLFRPQRLEIFKGHDHFLADVAVFLQEGFNEFRNTQDFETSLFFVELGLSLQRFFPGSALPDFREWVVHTLVPQMQKCEEPVDLSLAYKTLLHSYVHVRDPQGALLEQIATDIFAYRLVCEHVGSEEARYVQDKFLSVVLELVKNDQGARKRICDPLLMGYCPEAEVGGEWRGEGPEYHNGRYSIDLKKGIIRDTLERGRLAAKLPAVIRQDLLFDELSGGEYTKVVELSTGGYRVTTPRGAFKVQKKRYSEQLCIEKEGLRLVHDRNVLLSVVPTLVKKETQIWECPGQYLVGKEGGREVFCVEIAPDRDAQNKVKKIIRYVQEGDKRKEKVWIPFEREDTLQALETMPQFIECYGTHEGEVKEVHLPRLNLRFYKRDGRLYKEHTGYYLIEKEPVDGLPFALPYYLLENAAGDRKVLFPKMPIEEWATTDSNQHMQRKMQFSSTIRGVTPERPLPLVEFSIKEGQLTGYNEEAHLYLAYLFVLQNRWEEAEKHLKKGVSLERYTEEESTLIKVMAGYLARCEHPLADTFALKLLAQVEENFLKNPSEVKELFPLTAVYALYMKSCNHIRNAGVFALNKREELLVLGHLKRQVEQHKKSEREQGAAAAAINSLYKEIEEFIGVRERHLREGDFVLGKRHLVPFPRVNFSFPLLPVAAVVRDFEALFRETPTVEEARDKVDFDRYLTQVEGIKFHRHFTHYYVIARSGSDQERTRLLKMLDLHENVAQGIPLFMIRKLKHVCQNRNRFPALKTIQTLIEKKESAQRACNHYQFEYGHRWTAAERKEKKRRLNEMLKAEKALESSVSCFTVGRFQVVLAMIREALKVAWYIVSKIFADVRAFFGTRLKGRVAVQSAKIALPCEEMPDLFKRDAEEEEELERLVALHFNCKDLPVEHFVEQLPTAHPRPAVQKKLVEESRKLEQYRDSLEPTKLYEIKDNWDLLKSRVSLKVAREESALRKRKSAILAHLNHISDQSAQKGLHKIGARQHLRWESALQLFLMGDVKAFQEKTYLSLEEAKRFTAGVADYLFRQSRLKQLQHAQAILSQIDKEQDAKKKQMLVQHLVSFLLLKRYRDEKKDTGINRQKLTFEGAYYLFRLEQIEKLRDLLKEQGLFTKVLAEMPTGFGKTKLMIPALNASIEGHVTNIWPASIELTNAKDIRETMEEAFAKRVDRFNFDRKTAHTSQSLSFLYEELLLAEKEKIPLNVRPETLRSLQLHFISTLRALYYREGKGQIEEMRKRAECYLKILRFFRTRSVGLIDEEHINIDPRDKLIYTLGESEQMEAQYVALTEEMFRILTEPEFESVLKIRENSQRFLFVSEEENPYMKEIAPKLAARLFDYLVKKERDLPNRRQPKEKIANHCQGFSDWVLGKCEDIPAWIEKHPFRQLIALVKGQLIHVLEASLNGAVDETYGFSKENFKWIEFAIIYQGSNAPKEKKRSKQELDKGERGLISEFSNKDEALDKTYLTYLYKGLQKEQFHKLIRELQEQALNQTKEGVPFENTEANCFYRSLFEGEAPKKILGILKERDIDKLYDRLRFHREAIFFYIRTFVVPQLKLYPHVLVSTVQNLLTQVKSSIAVSATPFARETHAPKTRSLEMEGTSGKVTHLFLTKGKEKGAIKVVDSVDFHGIVQEVLDAIEANPKLKAIVDVGAWLKGKSNEEFAKILQQHFKEKGQISGLVFFDDERENFKVLDVESGIKQTLEEADHPLEERFTLYDQRRSYGSDIKQVLDAVALLLLGKGTTKATAGQGGGRLRQFDQGQTVRWLIQKPIAERIFSKDEGGKLRVDVMQLVVHLIENQADKEAGSNYRAQDLQMENEIWTPIMDKLEVCSVDGAVSSFGKFESELVQEQSFDPWVLYSGIVLEKEPIPCLQNHKSNCERRGSRLGGISSRERKEIMARLATYPAIWEKMLLPRRVKVANELVDQEILEEVEIDTQVEEYTQPFESSNYRLPWGWPEKMDLFRPGWEAPSRVSRLLFFKRIGMAIQAIGRAIVNGIKRAASLVMRKFFQINNNNKTPTIIKIIMIAVGIYLLSPFILSYYAFRTISNVYENWSNKGVKAAQEADIPIRNDCALFRLEEVLAHQLPSSIVNAKKFFDPNKLLVTNNFYQMRTQLAGEEVQKPLTRDQKPIFSVLVIQDSVGERESIKVVLIDLNDSQHFSALLIADQKTKAAVDKRRRKVGIYDYRLQRFIHQGKNGFDDANLLKNKEFQSLITQVKFLNGEVDFSPQELNIVEDRAAKAGFGAMGKFYEKALMFREQNRKCYHRKEIARVLGIHEQKRVSKKK